jgi:hypothetical protein
MLEDLGYSEDEVLDPADARAYEFLPDADGTNVVAADLTEDGFIISSLNETLVALAHDVMQVADA